MSDFFKRYWTPTWGAASSISFKGISDISQNPEVVDTATAITNNQPTLITYFMIGVVGALGGLIVKILWGILKHHFPKLSGIDK